MPYSSGSASVGTAATSIVSVGSPPNNDSVLIHNGGSASIYVGGSAVTTATGFPVASGVSQVIPTTGAESLQLFGIVAANTATVTYLSIT